MSPSRLGLLFVGCCFGLFFFCCVRSGMGTLLSSVHRYLPRNLPGILRTELFLESTYDQSISAVLDDVSDAVDIAVSRVQTKRRDGVDGDADLGVADDVEKAFKGFVAADKGNRQE